MKSVLFSEIFDYAATRYGATMGGSDSDISVSRPVTLNKVISGCLTFCTAEKLPETAAKTAGAVIVCTQDVGAQFRTNPAAATLILVDNPRLVFGRIVSTFFVPEQKPAIHPSAVIDSSASIGNNVGIGPGSVIGPDCVIGDGSVIGTNVALERNVRMGRNCTIRAGSALGQPGFGIETDIDGSNFQMPHIGGVTLEDDVTIGCLSTIASGTIEPTYISRNVVIDDHVFIAHNVHVGPRSLIIACAEVSGSAVIGADCWLGPNCTIMNKVTLGDCSLVGLGAAVTKSFPENVVLIGTPARVLKARYPD